MYQKEKFPSRTLPFDWTDSCATPHQKHPLHDLLDEFHDVFANHDMDLGCLEGYYFSINTENSAPIQQRPYRIPFHKRAIVSTLIQQLLEQGIIEPSESDWSSPIVLIQKKPHDGQHWRLCVDYRAVNRVTVKDKFPMALTADLFDGMLGAKYFTNLDMASGYHQLQINPAEKHKTSFVCAEGSF